MCKCAERGPQQLQCVDQENLKSNDFKQFTVLNGLSRRSKFPDEWKRFTCFQRL